MKSNKQIVIKTGRRKTEFTRAEIRGLIKDIFGGEKSSTNQVLKAAKRKKQIYSSSKNKNRVITKA